MSKTASSAVDSAPARAEGAGIGPGARLGRYELRERIGAGGMSEVYRALQHVPGGLKRSVVVKLIRPDRLAEPGAEERFLDEARNSLGLQHPHIVAVHDFGREQGQWFLVLEEVSGPSLAALLVALEPRLVHASVSGMETGLFAALLVAAGWPQDKLIATGGVYDPSWLEDAPLEQLERHRSERSPQSNLFPGTPADKQRKFPGGGVVKGRVEGGAPPVDLRAYDRSGREMGGMNLPALGPFSFDVAERARGLRVVAIDANGKRMQVEVLEGQGPLMIRF